MGLGAVVGKLDRLVGGFNRWFAPAAVATNAARSGVSKGVPPDSAAVVATLGEIEREDDPGEEPSNESAR